MAKGYFLTVGDKTTCGGIILTGSSCISFHGKPAALEGSSVTCGQYPGAYIILGGVRNTIDSSTRLAGTLNSVTSCLCQARLIHSVSDCYHE